MGSTLSGGAPDASIVQIDFHSHVVTGMSHGSGPQRMLQCSAPLVVSPWLSESLDHSGIVCIFPEDSEVLIPLSGHSPARLMTF